MFCIKTNFDTEHFMLINNIYAHDDVSTKSSFFSALFLNTILPINPARLPPRTAKNKAPRTAIGGLKANGAISPGIGDAVPGALLMMPKTAAETPARPPPKKLEQ